MATYTQLIDILLTWSTKNSYAQEFKQYFINPCLNSTSAYDIYVTNKISIITDSSTIIEDKSDIFSIITGRQADNNDPKDVDEIGTFLTNFDEKFYSNVKRIETQITKKINFFEDNRMR